MRRSAGTWHRLNSKRRFADMLNLVDDLILRILDQGWPAIPPPAKPGFFFTVPDEDWLTKVRSGVGLRLNIYLLRDQ